MGRTLLTLAIFALGVVGCAGSTIGPGAGAVNANVKGSVDDVDKRAQAVLKEMNIQVTGDSMKNAGNERQLVGRTGDTDVTITIDNANSVTSSVSVAASKNIINGDKDLAKEILNKIVSQS